VAMCIPRYSTVRPETGATLKASSGGISSSTKKILSKDSITSSNGVLMSLMQGEKV
jgi:hypothetical protein